MEYTQAGTSMHGDCPTVVAVPHKPAICCNIQYKFCRGIFRMEIKDLAGISEPLKRLIEVISEGVGAVAHPYLLKKNAEAKAYEIRVISQAMAESRMLLGRTNYEDGKFTISASSGDINQPLTLPERVEKRHDYQELRKQQNIESICANAAEELADKDAVPKNKPEPEWINRFFNIAENISTEELQYIWSKILAGEIQRPGSFSLRTLEIVKNISREEAENFVKLSQYVLRTEDNVAIFLDPAEYIFKKECILSFPDILALKDAGLVSDTNMLTFSFKDLDAGTTRNLIYGSLVILFEIQKNIPEIGIKVGALTRAGMELLNLVTLQPDMEYLAFIARRFYLEGINSAWARILKVEENLLHFENKTYFKI